MVVVCSMVAMVIAMELAVPLQGEARRLGWGWLLEAPWFALPGAASLLWQPTGMGILPVFLWSMAMLPGFLWLVERAGAWALLAPGSLYAAVQAWGWQVPGLGGLEVEFNPLAWQALFLPGAWFGRRALRQGHAIGVHRWGLAAALLVLAAGAGPGGGAHPGWGDASAFTDKQHLAPARVLHSLSLAYAVVALWRVRAVALHGAPMRALAAAGRQSLHVFCAGLFLSYGIAVLFRLHGWSLWLEALVLLGALALLAFAGLSEWSPGLTRAEEPAGIEAGWAPAASNGITLPRTLPVWSARCC